jgi:Ca2+-binding RTX toxin-like protein
VRDIHFEFAETTTEISAQIVEAPPPVPEVFSIGLDTGRVHVGSFDVGTDVVRIGNDLAASFEELQNGATIYQDGHSTVVEFRNGHDLLVLANTDVSKVSPEIFQFDVAAPTASETIQLGTEFNDELIFGTGAQMIDPGQGFDVVTGGAGADTFLFNAQSDRDFITDFTVGEDRIQIDQSWFENFDAMIEDAAIYQDGASTQIEFGGGQIITLYGLEASKVTQDCFVFA